MNKTGGERQSMKREERRALFRRSLLLVLSYFLVMGLVAGAYV
jgi:hypothetical protein